MSAVEPAPALVPYPALTVWQPWASLIAIGAKQLEFRSHARVGANVGRRLAIHAGARAVRIQEVVDLLCVLQGDAWRETGITGRENRTAALELLEEARGDLTILPRASVLCVATLGTPVRNQELAKQLGVPSVNDSDRGEHSNWGWPLSDVRRLEPFRPALGARGIWTWNGEPGL